MAYAAIYKAIRDSVVVARYRLLVQSRARTWVITASATGFFMVAPLVFLGETIVGENGERLEPFFSLTGYQNYTGYLAVPLVFAFLTNSAYSWIGQAIREEQQIGTLERALVSMRHPVSMLIGGAMAHLVFLLFFIGIGIASISLVADLRLDINWGSAVVVSLLHLYAVYGFAFVLTSLFLWIQDAFIVQQAISYFVIPILAGAGFPVEIFPGWLQAISKAIPFTWAFIAEREAFLRSAPIGELADEFAILAGISTALWIIAYFFFERTLRRARRVGSLGIY